MRASAHSPAILDGATGPIVIVAALPEEVQALLARVNRSSVLRLGGCRATCGRLGRAPVVVAVTGDGRAAAERGLDSILDALPAGLVLSIGVAGGLTPDLGPGTLVVGRAVLDGDRPLSPPDPLWLRRAERLGGAVLGICVTTRRILSRAADKTAIAHAVGQPGPLTVDLESATFARVAERRGIPSLAVRAVSDAAWEDLPLDFEALRGPHGGVSRLRVIVRTLVQPRAIPGLFALRRRVTTCAERLAGFVSPLVDPSAP
jgi:adenosylhomocysteine nucleosidase